MSELAIGTFRGDFSDEDSKMYRESLEYAIKHGIRRIDTAVNYRGMRSERDIGIVLERLIKENEIVRSDVIISTKCGFIPGDGEIMLRPVDYLKTKFIDSNILSMEDIYMNEDLRMTLHPGFFQYCINLSLKHLKTDYLDIHYIHEPELAYEKMGDELFFNKLEMLFDFYERQVALGKIKEYGMATWEAFQVPESHSRHLSIERIMKTVAKVNPKHHFKHIMLPYSLDLPDADIKRVQKVEGDYMTAFEAAKHFELTISTSGSIGVAKNLNENSVFAHIENARQSKYIDVTIVGMKELKHTKENIKIYAQLKEANETEKVQNPNIVQKV